MVEIESIPIGPYRIGPDHSPLVIAEAAVQRTALRLANLLKSSPVVVYSMNQTETGQSSGRFRDGQAHGVYRARDGRPYHQVSDSCPG